MASWFSPSDLQERLTLKELAELSTGSGGAAAPDDVTLQSVLDRAEVEIRGVLAGHAVPTTPLGLLRDIGLDLAVEALYLRQRGQAAKIPEGWDTRIKRSRLLLDRMGDGEIPIPGESVNAPAPPSHRMEALDPMHAVDGAFGGRR